jgi:hypothetical protein
LSCAWFCQIQRPLKPGGMSPFCDSRWRDAERDLDVARRAGCLGEGERAVHARPRETQAGAPRQRRLDQPVELRVGDLLPPALGGPARGGLRRALQAALAREPRCVDRRRASVQALLAGAAGEQ